MAVPLEDRETQPGRAHPWVRATCLVSRRTTELIESYRLPLYIVRKISICNPAMLIWKRNSYVRSGFHGPDAVILTQQELRELTQKQRPTAQARVLDFMGLPYRVRPDGSLAVLRAQVVAPTSANAKLALPEPVLQP